jgi:hypothetical protein
MDGSNAQNPIRGDNKKKKILYPLDFKLCILGGDTEDPKQIEALFELRALCEEHKIPLKMRDFDSDKEEDANLVKTLPAVYLLGKWGEVSEVLYPDEKLIDRVKTELLRCKDKFESKKQKSHVQESLLTRITHSIWPAKKSVASSK